MKVVVSHPTLQHSHQLAWALHERELLRQFCSGVPVLSPDESPPNWMPDKVKSRLQLVPLPSSLRRHPLVFQGMLRLGKRLPVAWCGDAFDHYIFHLYDFWYSRQLPRFGGDTIVAYENSAFHTFQVAKRLGMRCVLDAASMHHSVSLKAGIDTATPFRAEINRRKDVEVNLADMIITCSPLAAESYAAAGTPSWKLRSILLGATVPESIQLTSLRPNSDVLQYIYAGALRHLKAVDIILAVFRRLHSEGLSASLTLIGGVSDPIWLEEIAATPNAIYHPSIPQAQLFEKMAAADCLLLPSRFDSFGMVVAEAMACGIPAVLSTQVGAKSIIEKFPGSGWIIEPDAESLYRCLRDQIRDPQSVHRARLQALEAGRSYTWEAYRDNVGCLFAELLS